MLSRSRDQLRLICAHLFCLLSFNYHDRGFLSFLLSFPQIVINSIGSPLVVALRASPSHITISPTYSSRMVTYSYDSQSSFSTRSDDSFISASQQHMDPIDLNAMDLSGSGAAQNAGSNAGSNTAPSLTPELAQALFATIRSL